MLIMLHEQVLPIVRIGLSWNFDFEKETADRSLIGGYPGAVERKIQWFSTDCKIFWKHLKIVQLKKIAKTKGFLHLCVSNSKEVFLA